MGTLKQKRGEFLASDTGYVSTKERMTLLDNVISLCLQDEMLARFVVNSHVKHHPNAASNSEENEDEDEQQVGVPTI